MPADSPTVLATSGGYGPLRATPPAGPHRAGAPRRRAVRRDGRAPRRHCSWAPQGVTAVVRRRFDEAGRAAGFAVQHLHLFPMPNLDDSSGPPARPGRGLGRRRLGRQPARGVAACTGWTRCCARRWQAGVVLGGVCAGSICWHVGGTTDSFGPELRAVTDGLGLLPYGNGVHYDSEEQRRPLLHRLVADGTLPRELLHRRRRRAGLPRHRAGRGGQRAPTARAAYLVDRDAGQRRRRAVETRPAACPPGLARQSLRAPPDAFRAPESRAASMRTVGRWLHGVRRVDRHAACR